MHHIKFIQVSMAAYSAWSALVAFMLIILSSWTNSSITSVSSELLFFIVLALFHGIFSIWFWQGRQLPQFISATIYSRLFLACIYGSSAWHIHAWGEGLNLPPSWVDGYIVYLLAVGGVDLLSAIVSAIIIRSNTQNVIAEDTKSLNIKLSHEMKNRFMFAVYMIALGGWILLSTDSFIDFFHLPSTEFARRTSDSSILLGPIHLIGIFVILLATYNLIAVKYRLENLITAGVRGGLFTCLFVFLLVITDILHPITLLLPAVDLISVGVVLFYRLIRLENTS